MVAFITPSLVAVALQQVQRRILSIPSNLTTTFRLR